MEQPSFRKSDGAAAAAAGERTDCPDAGPEFCPVLPGDGINNPPESMFKRFWINIAAVTLCLAAFLLALDFAAKRLTPFIPFRWERKAIGDKLLEAKLDAHGRAKQDALRRIGRRLADAADLPDGMDVTVFYNPRRIANAFATFGGNIIVFDGLFDLVDTEDGLAMVLAHEIMHVKNRDAVKGVVRAVGLALLSSGLESGSYVDKIMDLGMSGYSREQEEAADLSAVAVLGKVYGHAGGATEFFRKLATQVERRDVTAGAREITALGSSHPDTLVRLRKTEAEARRLNIPESGPMTPLPDALDRSKIYIGTPEL